MTKKKPLEDKEKAGRPRLYESTEDMQTKIDEYFFDEETKGKPTMSGLAYFLGFEDRHGLSHYANYPEFSTTVKKARSRVEMALEVHLYGQAVTGAIFSLKNNFGWKDKREIDATLSIDDMRNQLYGEDT